MDDPTPTTPARRYSWPAFTADNLVAATHGAYSPRTWRPMADDLARQVVDVAPWTAGSAFGASVAAWSRTEAQVQLVHGWLDEHGPLDEAGEPRPATALLSTLETRAESLRARLGLDPLSLARLLGALANVNGAAATEGLESLRAAGRAAIAAADARALQHTQEAAQ